MEREKCIGERESEFGLRQHLQNHIAVPWSLGPVVVPAQTNTYQSGAAAHCIPRRSFFEVSGANVSVSLLITNCALDASKGANRSIDVISTKAADATKTNTLAGVLEFLVILIVGLIVVQNERNWEHGKE